MVIHDTRSPGAARPTGHVELGPGLGPELDRRLLGTVDQQRVLVLGSGAGHDAVGLALRGARVTAVDPDDEQISAGRDLAHTAGATVEFHRTEPAELAFLRADQVDLALSVAALSLVHDIDHVCRQVHRVLKPGSHFVISVPHPAALCADPVDPRRTTRRWDMTDPVGERWVHRAEDLVGTLGRANFEIDTLLERHGPGDDPLPVTLVVRGTKLGT